MYLLDPFYSTYKLYHRTESTQRGHGPCHAERPSLPPSTRQTGVGTHGAVKAVPREEAPKFPDMCPSTQDNLTTPPRGLAIIPGNLKQCIGIFEEAVCVSLIYFMLRNKNLSWWLTPLQRFSLFDSPILVGVGWGWVLLQVSRRGSPLGPCWSHSREMKRWPPTQGSKDFCSAAAYVTPITFHWPEQVTWPSLISTCRRYRSFPRLGGRAANTWTMM